MVTTESQQKEMRKKASLSEEHKIWYSSLPYSLVSISSFLCLHSYFVTCVNHSSGLASRFLTRITEWNELQNGIDDQT